jgi:hypothetical protein
MKTALWWRSDFGPIWHRVEPVFIDDYHLYSGQDLDEGLIEMPGAMLWHQACLEYEWWPEGEVPEGICSEPDLSRPVCPWCLLPDAVDPFHAQLAGLRFSDDHNMDFNEVAAFLAAATLSTSPAWWPEPTNFAESSASRPPRWSYEDDTPQSNGETRYNAFQRDVLEGRQKEPS